ncbi:hypothetical protein [Nesterenkonia sandarakina]|uniref:Uncharacterized protein n=1 Tax=Nesterenkonia sandarakina TaxID=272918 RepID=A0A2T0YAS1_9MICC|nr:hypothetical protein [Nesterenkonia sandarakina]PRZ11724.1 hypothetical protein BCL67_1348 [Nesterenkonia sandarakina]
MSEKQQNSMAAAMQRRKAAPKPPQGGGVAHTFREVTETTPTKKTTFDLPVEIHRTLRWEALKREISMRDVVLRYIKEGMERDGITPAPEN